MSYPDITRSGDVRNRKCLAQQNIDRLVAAHNLQGNNRRFAFQHLAQFCDGLHAIAVHANDHIILMQSGLRGRAALLDGIDTNSFRPVFQLPIAQRCPLQRRGDKLRAGRG